MVLPWFYQSQTLYSAYIFSGNLVKKNPDAVGDAGVSFELKG
jgi:hypothetical protein